MLLKYLLLGAVLLAIGVNASSDEESSRITWVGGSIQFPDKAVEAMYKRSGTYINKNMTANRIQISGDYAYLAFPKFKPGVAVTLGRVSLNQTGCDAKIQPFPCLLSQEEGNCQAIQNAVDLHIDAQDVLWVLDTGVVQALVNPIRKCPPKVVAFSVKTGKLLKTIDLSGLVSQASRIQYIVVEYTKNGRPYIYICDAATRSILVYDVSANGGWRVVLPRAVTSGCNTGLDVLYLNLVRQGCGNNFLVVSYLCGNRVFSIRTDYLRSGYTQGNLVELGRKPSPLTFVGTDLGSSIFLRIVGNPEILRWDTSQPLAAKNFVSVYKPDTSIFFSSQVIADQKLQKMRVLQANFADYNLNTVSAGVLHEICIMQECKE